jgi:hypothetical protein
MAVPLQQTGAAPTLVGELLTLLTAPGRAWPLLIERGKTTEVMLFSAASGVYVAFSGAQRLNLAEFFGFAWTTIGVVVVGAVMGLFALIIAGGLLSWSAEALHGHTRTERMHAVFGYSTWPFVPLLIVLMPMQLAAYGNTVFSAVRPPADWPIDAVVFAVELATIMLWLFMVVSGTSVAAQLTRRKAAEAVALSFLEAVVIGIFLLVILFISFMI